MLANVTTANAIAQEMTLPASEYLLDFRAESEEFLGIPNTTPL